MQKPIAQSYEIIPADYIAVLSSSVLVLISNLVLYRLASFHLGADGFAQYAIARRLLSFVLPLVCVGIGVALPKKIAETELMHDQPRAASCFMTSVSIVLPVAISVTLLINLFPSQFSYLILGNEKYNDLIPPLGICIIGLSLQSLCYSYLRGKLYIRLASLFQIGVSAIVPLLSFYLSSSKITFLFWYIGIFSIIASIPLLIGITFQLNWKIEFRMARALFSYGIRRVPGDFALGGLFALPSIFAAHFLSLSEAGIIALSASIINMATIVMSPFSVILLPHSARLIKVKKLSLLRLQLIKIFQGCIVFSLMGIIATQIFAEIGISYWLGTEHLKFVFIVRLMIFGILPFTIYICLRSVLDAAFFKAVNAQNIYISLIIFISICFGKTHIINSIYSIIISFLTALTVLGALTFYRTWGYIKLNDKNNFILDSL